MALAGADQYLAVVIQIQNGHVQNAALQTEHGGCVRESLGIAEEGRMGR